MCKSCAFRSIKPHALFSTCIPQKRCSHTRTAEALHQHSCRIGCGVQSWDLSLGRNCALALHGARRGDLGSKKTTRGIPGIGLQGPPRSRSTSSSHRALGLHNSLTVCLRPFAHHLAAWGRTSGQFPADCKRVIALRRPFAPNRPLLNTCIHQKLNFAGQGMLALWR